MPYSLPAYEGEQPSSTGIGPAYRKNTCFRGKEARELWGFRSRASSEGDLRPYPYQQAGPPNLGRVPCRLEWACLASEPNSKGEAASRRDRPSSYAAIGAFRDRSLDQATRAPEFLPGCHFEQLCGDMLRDRPCHPRCLIASHIIPWSVDTRFRSDPTNGLCLSATFDRLFDSGLMTVTPDLLVRFSSRITESKIQPEEELLCRYHNHLIRRPHRFLPSVEHLAWHQANRFKQ